MGLADGRPIFHHEGKKKHEDLSYSTEKGFHK
jgi:hypothetical protein